MENARNHLIIDKRELWYSAIPLLLLIPLLAFNDQLITIFIEGSVVDYLRLIMKILIVVFTMTIAIHSWLVFSHLLINHTLYIGSIFFLIALLEITNIVIAVPQSLDTVLIGVWIQILMRIALVIGMLLIIVKPRIKLTLAHRRVAYGIALFTVTLMLFILYQAQPLLENSHPIIPQTVQVLTGMIQGVSIYFLSKHYRRAPKQVLWLISGSVYLILSDLLFVFSKDYSAIWMFSALLYQFLAYYVFLKAIYYTSVEKPYLQLLKIKQDLEQSQQELTFQAYHDDITQLPNERLLLKTLKEELHKDGKCKAVISIEIDRLATISDSLGISNSNKMMKLVAERIQAMLPPHYFATKLRESQFVIYVNHVQTHEELIQFCLNLKSAMDRPLQVQLFSLKGNVNIGIAFNEKNCSAEELLMHAQLAMREASQIPQRFLFYKEHMSTGVTDRILLEQELHRALDQQEFYLDYQPQINLKTGKIESVEALVRWRHPVRGFVPPDKFIEIAEESGLIIPLGKWILETACLQAKVWEAQGLPKMKVAVNLSLGQLFQQDLVQMVKEILQRSKLEPSYLQLEITESMTMNIDQMTQLLHELKALGIQIAVDDFGTGYSSLSYLKEFPIDCLKIDRAFVHNIQHDANDEALVSMILSMAKHLRLKVVAEGIEEVAQLAFLIAGDCDYIQGYLFSKPITAEQLTATFKDLHVHANQILEQFKCGEEYHI
ncbi:MULTISPECIES: putative bifunctional diguanylate cyclase/phosphodiesterase [unclassified Lysinibacillus]|uniref:putative bifunctional diguanylate cyclase/phosphodiesterase n=1 Tax=unclassified Lysinibacillus TaxID=2636778 RepID=UPI0038130C74